MSARKRGASSRDSGEPARSTPSRESSKAPLIGKKRLVTRTVLPLLLIGVLYISAVWKSRKVTVFAGREETLALKSETVPCSNDYASERKLFTDCAPKTCGRAVSDDVVTAAEVQALMGIAKRGLSVSRSEGGASILDLHSGSVSHGKAFANVYKRAPGMSYDLMLQSEYHHQGNIGIHL